jgi:hypothetical protein
MSSNNFEGCIKAKYLWYKYKARSAMWDSGIDSAFALGRRKTTEILNGNSRWLGLKDSN